MPIVRWPVAVILVWLAMLLVGSTMGSMPNARAQTTGDPSFDVVNASPRTIAAVFVSLSTDSNWGNDRLGAGVALRAGERSRINLPQGPCQWDVLVVYDDGRREAKQNQNLCAIDELRFAGTQVRTVEGNPSFQLVNESGQTIDSVYASLSSESTWGNNRLGSGVTLEAGKGFQIDLPSGPCQWDVAVDYVDGRREEKRNQNLCATLEVRFDGGAATGVLRPPVALRTPTTPQMQSSDDPSFFLVNRSGRTIANIYAFLSADQTRGEDRLGASVLASDARHWIALPRGQCLWNIAVIYDNGRQEEKRALNLCTLTELIFDASGIPSADKPLVARSERPTAPQPAAKADDGCEGKPEASAALRGIAAELDGTSVPFSPPARVRAGARFEVQASVQPLADLARLRPLLAKVWCVEVRDFELKAELRGSGIAPTLRGQLVQPISNLMPRVWTWDVVASETGRQNLTMILHAVASNPLSEHMIKEFPKDLEIDKGEEPKSIVDRILDFLGSWEKIAAAVGATIGATVAVIKAVRIIKRRRRLAES